ncbi:MAG: hypothetical protein JOZ42_03590 [Acetobacteraceae bacterium]|nr:hypothetical protein [Acetobacteraceae bacterium]
MTRRIGLLAAAGLVLLPFSAMAQPGGVKGVDAMGDKDRPSADGWVQAPIPRTDAPSGETPGEKKPNKSAEAQSRRVPDTGKKLSPGQDPATPVKNPNDPAARAP